MATKDMEETSFVGQVNAVADSLIGSNADQKGASKDQNPNASEQLATKSEASKDSPASQDQLPEPESKSNTDLNATVDESAHTDTLYERVKDKASGIAEQVGNAIDNLHYSSALKEKLHISDEPKATDELPTAETPLVPQAKPSDERPSAQPNLAESGRQKSWMAQFIDRFSNVFRISERKKKKTELKDNPVQVLENSQVKLSPPVADEGAASSILLS